MSRIAFLTSHNRPGSRLSPRFGTAEWVMILDSATQSSTFVRNNGQNGRAVLDILVRKHCEDVVFAEIGPGAFYKLKTARIGGWRADGTKSVFELVEKFFRGELRLARKPTGTFSDRVKQRTTSRQ